MAENGTCEDVRMRPPAISTGPGGAGWPHPADAQRPVLHRGTGTARLNRRGNGVTSALGSGCDPGLLCDSFTAAFTRRRSIPSSPIRLAQFLRQHPLSRSNCDPPGAGCQPLSIRRGEQLPQPAIAADACGILGISNCLKRREQIRQTSPNGLLLSLAPPPEVVWSAPAGRPPHFVSAPPQTNGP